MLTGPASPE